MKLNNISNFGLILEPNSKSFFFLNVELNKLVAPAVENPHFYPLLLWHFAPVNLSFVLFWSHLRHTFVRWIVIKLTHQQSPLNDVFVKSCRNEPDPSSRSRDACSSHHMASEATMSKTYTQSHAEPPRVPFGLFCQHGSLGLFLSLEPRDWGGPWMIFFLGFYKRTPKMAVFLLTNGHFAIF